MPKVARKQPPIKKRPMQCIGRFFVKPVAIDRAAYGLSGKA